MPRADDFTSEVKSVGSTERSPQYRMTIASAAPPQSSGVCGRKGTSMRTCPSAGSTAGFAAAARVALHTQSIAIAAGARRHGPRKGVPHLLHEKHDENENQQQRRD